MIPVKCPEALPIFKIISVSQSNIRMYFQQAEDEVCTHRVTKTITGRISTFMRSAFFIQCEVSD